MHEIQKGKDQIAPAAADEFAQSLLNGRQQRSVQMDRFI